MVTAILVIIIMITAILGINIIRTSCKDLPMAWTFMSCRKDRRVKVPVVC